MQPLVSCSLAGKGISAVSNDEAMRQYDTSTMQNTDIQHIPEFGST